MDGIKIMIDCPDCEHEYNLNYVEHENYDSCPHCSGRLNPAEAEATAESWHMWQEEMSWLYLMHVN